MNWRCYLQLLRLKLDNYALIREKHVDIDVVPCEHLYAWHGEKHLTRVTLG